MRNTAANHQRAFSEPSWCHWSCMCVIQSLKVATFINVYGVLCNSSFRLGSRIIDHKIILLLSCLPFI